MNNSNYSKNSVFDKFYTKVENLPDLSGFLELNTNQFYIEPSVGSGNLLKLIKNEKFIGYDISPDILGDNILTQNFLEVDLNFVDCITIMNPPFGKNSTLAIKFFNKAATVSKKIICIVPLTFLKVSLQKKLNCSFHLLESFILPLDSFTVDGSSFSVPTCLQVWERKEYERLTEKQKTTTNLFSFGSYDDHDYALRRAGSKAGQIIEPSGDVDGIYWIKSTDNIKKIISSIDFSDVVKNTAGVKSLSKHELISMVEKKYESSFKN